MSHLLEQNLMSPWQSSFCPSHSTTTTLLHITSEWFSALDCGLFVGAIFSDIYKASDTVNHELLVSIWILLLGIGSEAISLTGASALLLATNSQRKLQSPPEYPRALFLFLCFCRCL